MKQKRMLLLADWHQAASGYGTVMKNLLPVFKESFGEIVFVAVNYYGEPYREENVLIVSAKNFFIPAEGEDDPFGRHSFLNVLATDQIGIDLCFMFNDVNIIQSIVPTMRELQANKQAANKRNFKTVAYFPIDSQVPKGYFDGMNFFDLLITYNEYSRKEVGRHNGSLLKKTKVIPHGTNTHEFFEMPQPEIRKFRRLYFAANSEKVIITNVNRNQPRKAIGDTILSFIEAKKLWNHKRPLFLYLHMLDKDQYMSGYDLKTIFAQTDLIEGEDYMIAPQEYFTEQQGADIATLRGIYNASDVYVTNTLGEGWGLSVTEAMACRLPVVAPNHTSLIEIGGNGQRMYHLEELDPFINQFDSTIRMRANIYECAEKICEAAEENMGGTKSERVDNAKKYVNSLKWDEIAQKFLNYFNDIL